MTIKKTSPVYLSHGKPVIKALALTKLLNWVHSSIISEIKRMPLETQEQQFFETDDSLWIDYEVTRNGYQLLVDEFGIRNQEMANQDYAICAAFAIFEDDNKLINGNDYCFITHHNGIDKVVTSDFLLSKHYKVSVAEIRAVISNVTGFSQDFYDNNLIDGTLLTDAKLITCSYFRKLRGLSYGLQMAITDRFLQEFERLESVKSPIPAKTSLVYISHGKAVTTPEIIANNTRYHHSDILAAIRKITDGRYSEFGIEITRTGYELSINGFEFICDELDFNEQTFDPFFIAFDEIESLIVRNEEDTFIAENTTASLAKLTRNRNIPVDIAITIDMTSKSGYQKNQSLESIEIVSRDDSPTDVLLAAIKEIAFIAYFNVGAMPILSALHDGLKLAQEVDIKSDDIPF